LEAELKLTPDQVEKVDAIYASVRPKFGQLRDLPEAERAKARERITADIRARIAELLTPEQKPRYAAMVAEQAGRTVTRGRIYLMDAEGKPKAFNARLGISDGTSTELIVPPNSADVDTLKEGAAIITGTVTPGSASSPARPATTGPRMGF
jgi:HlyD family secretion protein